MRGRHRHIFIVSDATGHTCELVVKAALTQFDTSSAILHKVQYVRDTEQVKKVVEDTSKLQGVVVFTLVSPDLRKMMYQEGVKRAVPTIDIMGPILSRFTDLLEISPLALPGLFRHLDEDYFARIEAIDFAVKHDDGCRPEQLPLADLVLVGVSRTSKTPISVYLSYKGYKVANVPIIIGVKLPPQVYEIDKRKVVGLTIRPDRLQAIRMARISRLGMDINDRYVDIDKIKEEIRYSTDVFNKAGWMVINVTSKSIEESATMIMELTGGIIQSSFSA
jgi:hypothetical protein